MVVIPVLRNDLAYSEVRMWWDSYNLFRGEDFDAFWRDHLQDERNLLFIVGQGFDPRVLGPLRRIIAAKPEVRRQCIAVDIRDCYMTDEAASGLRQSNIQGLNELFPNGTLEVRHLVPTDVDGIRNVSRNVAVLFNDVEQFADRTDIILDISALPRLIYLTLLNQLLAQLVRPNAITPLASNVNFHVVYAEAALIDASIAKREVDVELAPMQNLSIRLDEEASLGWPVVWFPVLGEDVADQLLRIWERTDPDEVCPVLPIQSADPRRGDNIVRDIGELIFDRFNADPRDIVHATEWNPFQLYRSLLSAMARYEETLRFFGGIRFVISPLSSKSLSIGCLLACFEKRICGDQRIVRAGMAHVETRRYEAAAVLEAEAALPTSLWLTGETYVVQG